MLVLYKYGAKFSFIISSTISYSYIPPFLSLSLSLSSSAPIHPSHLSQKSILPFHNAIIASPPKLVGIGDTMHHEQMSCNGMPSSSFFPPNFMLQMQTPHDEIHQPPPLSPLPPTHDFRGVSTMLGKRSMSFTAIEPCEEMNGEEDLSDDCSQAGEKKRRLSMDQVRTLEKNFEQGNKLEPERKLQLARALGLQPRQIAIWFQNRRARWKTKTLEKDYELLKKQFDAVKTENDALQSQNKKLQAEILGLRGGRESSELINLNKETEGSCSNRSENSSEINLDISRTSAIESPLHPQQSLSFFPPLRPPGLVQLLQSSSRSDIQCPKIEHGVPDESFSNLLCSMEDHSAFWPWPDHNNFH